jgi:glycosyltransferase involved in cell wall biosynthesis
MLGRKSMAGVDVFSLPAMERLEYFPLDTLKSQPVFIPNYPSRGHYTNIERKENYGDIRLVYQGSLGRNHGFEQLIEWLDRKIDDKRWSLTLLGKISGDYKQELLDKAIDYGVGNRFHIREFVPFTDLPAELSKYTIGLALHLPVGVTYTTGGTASNKIYEYAACGLPVVLYDTPHYRNHLGRRFWVDFCQLSWPGFSGAVSRLLAKGDDATNAARMDFELELNYESVFPKAWSIVLNTMSEKLKYNHSNKRNTFFEKK